MDGGTDSLCLDEKDEGQVEVTVDSAEAGSVDPCVSDLWMTSHQRLITRLSCRVRRSAADYCISHIVFTHSCQKCSDGWRLLDQCFHRPGSDSDGLLLAAKSKKTKACSALPGSSGPRPPEESQRLSWEMQNMTELKVLAGC